MKFSNCLLSIFVLLKIFAIGTQGTLNCTQTFNISDSSTYWYFNSELTCQFCPVDPSNGYCPLYPNGPAITSCKDCVEAYCGITAELEWKLSCGL